MEFSRALSRFREARRKRSTMNFMERMEVDSEHRQALAQVTEMRRNEDHRKALDRLIEGMPGESSRRSQNREAQRQSAASGPRSQAELGALGVLLKELNARRAQSTLSSALDSNPAVVGVRMLSERFGSCAAEKSGDANVRSEKARRASNSGALQCKHALQEFEPLPVLTLDGCRKL